MPFVVLPAALAQHRRVMIDGRWQVAGMQKMQFGSAKAGHIPRGLEDPLVEPAREQFRSGYIQCGCNPEGPAAARRNISICSDALPLRAIAKARRYAGEAASEGRRPGTHSGTGSLACSAAGYSSVAA